MKKLTLVVLVLAAMLGLSVAAMLKRNGPSETPHTPSSIAAKSSQTADAADTCGPGMAAIANAAAANKYLFVFFWKQEDEQTAAMKGVFEEAMKGVQDFKGDSRFGHATEVVMLDPADTAERFFLADLKIDPQESEAMTAFLVPPGSVVAEFKGATDKEALAAALQKASTSCGPGGCGPGGCGPKK